MFDTPSAGSSPVPAQYGSLGGGFPRDRARPERQPRERKPFRWKAWREEPEDPARPPPTAPDPADRGEADGTSHSPVAYARTSGGAPASAPSPAAPRARSTTPVGDRPAVRRPTPSPRVAPPESPAVWARSGRRPAPDDGAPSQPVRRSRVVPPVPRNRLDVDGRVLPQTKTLPPEPEPRPAAYLKETVRTRQVIRHLDITTVLRVSLLFYFLVVLVLLIAGVLLWNVAAALGTITSIDKSIRTLFDLTTFHLRPLPVLAYSGGIGVVLVAFGTMVNILGAVIFNLISDVTGGVAVRVVAQPDDE